MYLRSHGLCAYSECNLHTGVNLHVCKGRSALFGVSGLTLACFELSYMFSTMFQENKSEKIKLLPQFAFSGALFLYTRGMYISVT